MSNEYEFYKEKKGDTIWRVHNKRRVGEVLFSFDKKTLLNLWTDYPEKFTPEQKKIFDKEQPFWADYFKE